MTRLVLRQEVREEAQEAALEAAFKFNDEKELSYHIEEIVIRAVEAALAVVEERLG